MTSVVDANGDFLLWEACDHARVDTARFLLDNEPRFRHAHSGIGNIHTVSRTGKTALLAAARSFTVWEDVGLSDLREHLARSEQLMSMLLDRGASAQDHITFRSAKHSDPTDTSKAPVEEVQSHQTVLSRAISHASPALVRRLIDGGADIHVKTSAPFAYPPFAYDWKETFRDVTLFHIGSYYLNIEGVQALIDSQADAVKMVSSRDNHGCLPLHWANGVPYNIQARYVSSGRDVAEQRISILKLLLGLHPGSINARGNLGETTLMWATKNCGPSPNTDVAVLKFLCDNGADAGIQDKRGWNALHWLAYFRHDNEPIDTNIIDLFLAHGASVGDKDEEGNTPLHLVASWARQVNAVKFLIRRGADPSVRNLLGDTPLHAAANAQDCTDFQKKEADHTRGMNETMRIPAKSRWENTETDL